MWVLMIGGLHGMVQRLHDGDAIPRSVKISLNGNKPDLHVDLSKVCNCFKRGRIIPPGVSSGSPLQAASRVDTPTGCDVTMTILVLIGFNRLIMAEHACTRGYEKAL